MSGHVALRDAIKHVSKRTVEHSHSMRRGTVVAIKPTITVELLSYSHLLHADNDLTLSSWAQWYDHVVGIEVDDMVIVQEEATDWVLVDVVTSKDVRSAFEDWRTS